MHIKVRNFGDMYLGIMLQSWALFAGLVAANCDLVSKKCSELKSTPPKDCVEDVTLKRNLTNYDDLGVIVNPNSINVAAELDPVIVQSCANSKYVPRAFSPAGEKSFNLVSLVLTALKRCFRNVLMGFRNVDELPKPDPAALAGQAEEPIPEIVGPCNKLASSCRSIESVRDIESCQAIPLPSVNEKYIEGCRLADPQEGISKTACDKINIICRKAALAGDNDELLFAFCNLSVIQSKSTVPGTRTRLPPIDATLIKNCKAESLAKATSIKPQPYYYDIGFKQNMTIAEYEEVINLMIASNATLKSYDDFTSQQIYDLEVAENVRWRALSQNLTMQGSCRHY